MYVAIDMQALRFLPVAHPSVTVLTNLIWLEQSTEDEVWMFDAYDTTAFTTLNAYQQSKLYCNTVGVDKPPRFGEALCRLLVELAIRIPMRDDVQPVRLEMQCAKVAEANAGLYLYDPTGYSAVVKPDLWQRKPVELSACDNVEAVAAAPRPARPALKAPAPVTPAVSLNPAQPTATPATGITQPWLQAKPVQAITPAVTVPKTVPAPAVNSGIKKPWEK